MFRNWTYFRHSGNGGLQSRLDNASDAMLETLRDAGDAVARRRDAGVRFARAAADTMMTGGRRAGHSVRHVVEDRPAESLLLVAIAAFAVGWLARSMMRKAADDGGSARKPSPARRTRRQS